MTSRAGLLAALLCLLAPAARGDEPPAAAAPATVGPAGAEPAKAGRLPGAVLDEVTGTVTGVDRQRQVVTIDAGGAPVELRLDRNTLVYQPGGATTVLSIVPGVVVRSGLDSARRAFWVQIRPPEPAAAAEKKP